MESALWACLLLLWTLTAAVSNTAASDIVVTDVADGIKLQCTSGEIMPKVTDNTLKYDDTYSKEYKCVTDGLRIFVKFRTCNNCIEVDAASIAGMIVGNVVATLVIGVAVYLVASQTPVGSGTKSHAPPPTGVTSRFPAASNGRMSPTDDHYQPLQKHQKGLYDKLQGNRGHSTPR